MDHQLVVQQTKVETAALEHSTRALEVAISWVVKGDDVSRKLSSVRFATERFQRHMERLFSLEEVDGYMERVCRLHPEWLPQVADMRRDHEQFRAVVRKVAVRLERASTADGQYLTMIGDDLKQVIQQILQHNDRESDMLVESMLRDTGGQG